MKRRQQKKGLERRIFFLFAVLTLVLIFGITGIEWIFGANLLRRSEEESVREIINSCRAVQSDIRSASKSELSELVDSEDFNSALSIQNHKHLHLLIAEHQLKQSSYFTVFDNQNNRIYGEEWEVLTPYQNVILEYSKNDLPGDFFFSLINKNYHVAYIPVYSNQSGDWLGTVIKIINVTYSNINIPQNRFFISPYPLPENIIGLSQPENLRRELDHILAKMVKIRTNEDVIRISNSLIYGIFINYNNQSEPSSVMVFKYPRELRSLARQSFLTAVFAILAVTLAGIFLIGSWFSKKVIQPIQEIKSEMYRMEKNPADRHQIKKEYDAELGDVVAAFNRMKMSVSDFAEYLKEYKLVADNLDQGFFGLDEKFNIILSNESFREIFHIPERDNIQGTPITKYVPLNKFSLKKLLKDNKPVNSFEFSSNSAHKYLVHNIKEVKTEGRLKIIGSVTDVTEIRWEQDARETLELELIKSNKLAEIGARAEGIVHNINSPLNSIMGYSQLLKKEIDDHADVDKIIKNAGQIAEMVKSLLLKVREDNISMQRKIDLNQLVNQELEQLQHNIYFKHHVKLETDLDEKLPEIYAVYGDVSQCVASILNNAIDAVHDSNEQYIWVKSYLAGNMAAIDISDTGIGIPDELIDKIFEPAYTTKRGKNYNGFGLGLAISKRLVEKNKGEIVATSKIGIGSTFTLYFPLYQNEN